MIDFEKYELHSQEPFADCENPNVPYAKWVLQNIKPTTVLDVGCGTGVHTKWFNDNGMHCYGITINRVEIEKRCHPHVQYGDMCCIPFGDKEFDLVFCLGTLEHTISPYIAMCEFNRVLKDDSYLFVDMPPFNTGMQIMEPRAYYHKTVLFPIQMRDLFVKTGFVLVGGEFEEIISGDTYQVKWFLPKQLSAPLPTMGYYLCRKK